MEEKELKQTEMEKIENKEEPIFEIMPRFFIKENKENINGKTA